MGQNLLSVVVPVNARAVWRQHVTSLVDTVPDRNDAGGQLEKASGYHQRLTGDLDWGPGDPCWVISNSGRNALVVEFAQEARRLGVEVVALTSIQHSTAVPPTPGLPARPESAPPADKQPAGK